MDLSPHELQIPVNTGFAMHNCKAPSYLDMGKIRRTLRIDSTEYEFLEYRGLVPDDKVVYGELNSYYNASRPLGLLGFIEGHQNWRSSKCLFQKE